MEQLTGSELEDFGHNIFTKMGLECVHRLKQASLAELDPTGSHAKGENIEFDYLIPYRTICFIGEITDRTAPKELEKKFRKFRRHYSIVKRIRPNNRFWQSLGVPTDRLRRFRGITEFRGFFITPKLEQFDVSLPKTLQIASFYRSDWRLLCDYADSIGSHARYPFLEVFDISGETGLRPLEINQAVHNLVVTQDKKITSGDDGLADIYTFEASPYDLLPLSRVYRRDNLPDLSSPSDEKYQRPLIGGKLGQIRKILLAEIDFMFPNSILVVLSKGSGYDPRNKVLRIADIYGSISIIDGQHRLFSYANKDIEEKLGDESKILVTAIQFKNADEQAVLRYSAKAFVEINKNQTSIKSTHIDAIAYEILGMKDEKAIAAKIILDANKRPNSCLYGLLDTSQTGLGIIKATTVLSDLKTMTRIRYLERLREAGKGSARALVKQGYTNLFEVSSIEDLINPENLVRKGVICIERYFGLVKSVFPHDWPERGRTKNSSLEYAKMFTGFVKLLWELICEGLNWTEVQAELFKVRNNIMTLRGIRRRNIKIFDPEDSDIPDAKPSAAQNYRFLRANRHKPTSVQDVNPAARTRKRTM